MKKARITIPYEENKDKNIIHMLSIFRNYQEITMEYFGDLIKQFRNNKDFYIDVNIENFEMIEHYLKDLQVTYQMVIHQ
jgi:hypothetical protein